MNRNIIQSKSHIFEKVFRDKDGKLVRARFAVYENAGRIKARLVDYVYVTAGAISGKVLSLNSLMSRTVLDIKAQICGLNIKSPYFNKESIYFSGSKPRAPTF